jgi:transcriptional regulator with XRE-family HTH domain
MSFDAETFGWRIREAIEEAGYTITEAATIMGTPHSRISEYCSGAVTPPVKRIYEIVERLGLDIQTIFPANVINHARVHHGAHR